MKWYEKSWVIVLFIVLFFPVGLFLLWKYGHFKPKTKKIITAVVAVIFVFSLFTPKQDKPQNETPSVSEQDTEQTSTDETKNQDDPKEPDVPEPNTSEMVDYIASKAKNDAQSITQEQTDKTTILISILPIIPLWKKQCTMVAFWNTGMNATALFQIWVWTLTNLLNLFTEMPKP